MIIYQPATCTAEHGHLNLLAQELARYLFPHGKIFSCKVDTQSVHLLLQTPSALNAFEFYARRIGEEVFESLLTVASGLESKQKNANNPLIRGICLCILARGFSQDFSLRIPFGFANPRLYEWHPIRSESSDAILIRELKPEPVSKRPPSHTELSTPELVALARLGMELRERSLRNSQFA